MFPRGGGCFKVISKIPHEFVSQNRTQNKPLVPAFFNVRKFTSFIHYIGIIVLVDVQASRLPVLAGQGEESFNHALLVFTLCLSAGVVLIVLCTLCMFLILMNAAYKVRSILIFERNFVAILSFGVVVRS